MSDHPIKFTQRRGRFPLRSTRRRLIRETEDFLKVCQANGVLHVRSTGNVNGERDHETSSNQEKSLAD